MESVPIDLKQLPVWLCWKLIPAREPGKKGKKLPFYADGKLREGTLDTPDDRARLVTFDAALAAQNDQGMTGVGIALGPVPGLDVHISGLDFDHIEQDDPRLRAVLEAEPNAYAEVSPSGDGVHILGIGRIGTTKSNGLEIYDHGRYFTVTGAKISGSSGLVDLAAAAQVARREFQVKEAEPVGPNSTDAGETFGEGGRNNALTRYAGQLTRAGAKGAELLEAVHLANKHRCRPPLHDDEVDAIVRSAHRNFKGPRELALHWYENLAPTFPPQLIAGLLPEGSLAIAYGESGSGKSFFVLDLALHVAAGVPWRGRKVQRGLVVYVAAESQRGLEQRALGYRSKQPDLKADGHFAVVGAINLHDDKAADTVSVVAAVHAAEKRAGAPCRLIVIDTLARVMGGGNENDARDMNTLISNVDQIRAEVPGAVVMMIHHTGKDSTKGARGHSSLVAAVDVSIEVGKGEENEKLASVIKSRDLPSGDQFGFVLKPIEIGRDADDQPVTSCLVEALNDVTRSRKRPRGSVQAAILMIVEREKERVFTKLELKEHVGKKKGGSVDGALAGLIEQRWLDQVGDRGYRYHDPRW